MQTLGQREERLRIGRDFLPRLAAVLPGFTISDETQGYITHGKKTYVVAVTAAPFNIMIKKKLFGIHTVKRGADKATTAWAASQIRRMIAEDLLKASLYDDAEAELGFPLKRYSANRLALTAIRLQDGTIRYNVTLSALRVTAKQVKSAIEILGITTTELPGR
jgi:hypothetical protein